MNECISGAGHPHCHHKIIQSFVVDKLPDNGTLVPKHIGVGT